MSAHKPFERKHFFIDRRLQGRYMLTFLVPMLIMLAFMVFTLYFASQSIVGTATSMVREGVDNIVVGTLQDEPEPTVQMYQGIVSEVRDYLRTFSSDTRYRRLMVVTLMWVFGLGVLIVIQTP